MKALVWYGRRNLKYEDVPEPVPARGQVKVKVRVAGICGTDLREYSEGPCMIPPGKSRVILGHEFSGLVEEPGEGADGFAPGERVTALGYWACGTCYYCRRYRFNLCDDSDFAGLTQDGCMAEYLVMPAFSLYKLPAAISDEQGTLVEPLAVALHAVRLAKVRMGDTVGIVGDGPVALCTLLSARAAGASAVYVVAKHGGRAAVARGLGATRVVRPGDGDPAEAVRDLTGGLGCDVSFEAVGRADALQLAVGLTRKGGTTAVMGVFARPAPMDIAAVQFNEKTIIGSSIYVDEAGTAIDLLVNGRIDPGALLTSKVPLKDAVESGFERLLANKDDNIKILLEVP